MAKRRLEKISPLPLRVGELGITGYLWRSGPASDLGLGVLGFGEDFVGSVHGAGSR